MQHKSHRLFVTLVCYIVLVACASQLSAQTALYVPESTERRFPEHVRLIRSNVPMGYKKGERQEWIDLLPKLTESARDKLLEIMRKDEAFFADLDEQTNKKINGIFQANEARQTNKMQAGGWRAVVKLGAFRTLNYVVFFEDDVSGIRTVKILEYYLEQHPLEAGRPYGYNTSCDGVQWAGTYSKVTYGEEKTSLSVYLTTRSEFTGTNRSISMVPDYTFKPSALELGFKIAQSSSIHQATTAEILIRQVSPSTSSVRKRKEGSVFDVNPTSMPFRDEIKYIKGTDLGMGFVDLSHHYRANQEYLKELRQQSVSNRRDAAVAKLLGAAVAHIFVLSQDENSGAVSSAARILAQAGRDELVDGAFTEFFPGLSDFERRGVRRVVTMYLDGKLSLDGLSRNTAREEIIEALKGQNPSLGNAAQVADLIYDFHTKRPK